MNVGLVFSVVVVMQLSSWLLLLEQLKQRVHPFYEMTTSMMDWLPDSVIVKKNEIQVAHTNQCLCVLLTL